MKMTKARQEAFDMVAGILEHELNHVKYQIIKNKSDIKNLVAEQTRLKRSRGILTNQIRTVKGEKTKETDSGK